MELTTLQPKYQSIDQVLAFQVGMLYFVTGSRNAWHSTEITQYHSGCMHTSLASAKAFAETQRTPGTSFRIRQQPCLALRSRNQISFVTQINTAYPLQHYSLIPLHHIRAFPSTYLRAGEPLRETLLSFHPQSCFWPKPLPLKDSVLFFKSDKTKASIEPLPESPLTDYYSRSHGGNYLLGWRKKESPLDPQAITRLLEATQ